mmetsp:Transcript_27548/g.36121  ORF Transcript_27548/g.36121 Transcript_27548/m.36121 type:complete len:541 (+) Transcript_27548:143-1765(+)
MNHPSGWVPTQDHNLLFNEDDYLKQSIVGFENPAPQITVPDNQLKDSSVSTITNQNTWIKSEQNGDNIFLNNHIKSENTEAMDFSNPNLILSQQEQIALEMAKLHRRVSSDPTPKLENMDGIESVMPSLNRLSTADFFFGPEMGFELLSANAFGSPLPIDTTSIFTKREAFPIPVINIPNPSPATSYDVPTKTGLKRNLSEPNIPKNQNQTLLYKDVLGINSDDSDNDSCSENEFEYLQFLSESFMQESPTKKQIPNSQMLPPANVYIKNEDFMTDLPKVTPRPMHYPTLNHPLSPAPMDLDEQRGCAALARLTCPIALTSPCPGGPSEKTILEANPAPAKKAFKRGPVTKCQSPGCTKWCTYGYDGQKPMFCKPHMLPGMVDMASRRCCHDDCRKSSSFAFKGQQPKYCRTHMEPGMVNVVSRQCEKEGCTSQPGFGFEGQKPKFCGKHKEPGMLYIRNKCVVQGCGKTKKFAHPGGKPTHCRIHQLEGMVSCVKKRKCDFPGCESAPSFTTTAQGKKFRFCAKHKVNGMVTLLASGNL